MPFDVAARNVLNLKLPWPPSVNRYYVNRRGGGRAIGAEGRKFRAIVCQALEETLPADWEALKERLQVWVECYPPDLRRRDLDNIKKALLDALTHAGIYEDDCLIDDLRSVRCPKAEGGYVVVHIGVID